MLFISVVNKYTPQIIAAGVKLKQDYYIKTWKDVQREIGTPEKEINLLLKNKKLPSPSRSKIRRAINILAEVSENKRH